MLKVVHYLRKLFAHLVQMAESGDRQEEPPAAQAQQPEQGLCRAQAQHQL